MVVNKSDMGLFKKQEKLVTSLQVNRKHYEELELPKNKMHSRVDCMFDLAEKPTYLRDQEQEKVLSSLLSDDLQSLQRAAGAQFFDKSSGKNEPSEELPSDNDSWIIRDEPVTQEKTVLHVEPKQTVPTFELKASASVDK